MALRRNSKTGVSTSTDQYSQQPLIASFSRALSALHLVVLQALAMSHACPEQLLRVNDRALRNLFSPLSGLDEVIRTSNFDMFAFKAKLESLGIATSHC